MIKIELFYFKQANQPRIKQKLLQYFNTIEKFKYTKL